MGHNYGRMDQTMEIMHTERKGPKLSTLEQFCIHEITKKGMQIKDTLTDMYKPIFDTLIKYYIHYQGYPLLPHPSSLPHSTTPIISPTTQ
jgi:hypothetical protein